MSPFASTQRSDLTWSKVSTPIAPAFIRRLPPTSPGIPSIHSNPPMLCFAAAPLSCFNFTPAPARISMRPCIDFQTREISAALGG